MRTLPCTERLFFIHFTLNSQFAMATLTKSRNSTVLGQKFRLVPKKLVPNGLPKKMHTYFTIIEEISVLAWLLERPKNIKSRTNKSPLMQDWVFRLSPVHRVKWRTHDLRRSGCRFAKLTFVSSVSVCIAILFNLFSFNKNKPNQVKFGKRERYA